MARRRKRRAARKSHAPKIRHRRRVRRHRRRAANPHPVLFANPRRKRRRSKRRTHVTAFRPRRRRRRAVAHVGRRRRRLHAGGIKLRRRRRSNPGSLRLGKFGPLLKIGIFGGLGIVTARVGMHLYDKYLAKTVEGGATTGARAWLGKAARILSGGIVVIGVEKGLARAHIAPQNRLAFKIGGLAESGRQAIGLAVKQLAPTTDLSWALNGSDPRMLAAYGYGDYAGGDMGELEDVDSFGELEDADSFMGGTVGRGGARGASHPFASGGHAY